MTQMTSEERIKADLTELKEKVARLQNSNAALHEKRDTNPQYIEASEKLHEAQAYRIELGSRMSDMRKQASKKILVDGQRVASYTKNYAGKVETTIRPEVIEAIKANLAINKLKGSQVEKIASDLISMIVSSEDINLSGQLVMAAQQEELARDKLNSVEQMVYMNEGKRFVSTYEYEKEITRLEEVLADPVKLKKEIERALIPSKIPDIYNALRAKGMVT